jgi:hypothetical protein
MLSDAKIFWVKMNACSERVMKPKFSFANGTNKIRTAMTWNALKLKVVKKKSIFLEQIKCDSEDYAGQFCKWERTQCLERSCDSVKNKE